MTMGVCGIVDEQIIATVLTILACMIDVIGFAAPYWYFDDSGKEYIYFGIWQYCTSNPATSCINLPNIQTWQVVVQAMESIGLVFLLMALFFLYPKLFCFERRHCIRYLVVCFLLSSATFVLLGVIIYGTMAPLGWIDNIYFGFAFVIISAGIAVISACFLCLCQQKHKIQITHLKHYSIITKHSG
ncbi:uncharacterized protein LOC134707425 isoform X1 [Mytilus trossulus]|uniref:uncharacterized protein LOC134707425 isoform X1 n=1 Tax=Mytilus trossulus TaxID=6551 RepID=UPI003006B3D7